MQVNQIEARRITLKEIGQLKLSLQKLSPFIPFPRHPVSLYYQTLFCLIRRNQSIDLSRLRLELRQDYQNWADIYPRQFFSDQMTHIPIILRIACLINTKIRPAYQRKGKDMSSLLSDQYDKLSKSTDNKICNLSCMSKKEFINLFRYACQNCSLLPLLSGLSLDPDLEYQVYQADSLIKLFKLACSSGSYSLVLYWSKVFCLHTTVQSHHLDGICQDILTEKSIFKRKILKIGSSPSGIRSDRSITDIYLYNTNRDKSLRGICHLMNRAFGVNILLLQIKAAAARDDLEEIIYFMSSPGFKFINYINQICLVACQAGSIRTIQYLIPQIPDNWKQNKDCALAISKLGNMKLLDLFLRRKHRISPMINSAIQAGCVRSFAFLFLVMAQDPRKISDLESKFGESLIRAWKNGLYWNPNCYIILRYLAFLKLQLGLDLDLDKEIEVAGIYQDTQLIEYLRFRANYRNLPESVSFNCSVEFGKIIGFPVDQNWVDRLESRRKVTQAAFEMLLESTYFVKRGIERLILNPIQPKILDLKWALKRSIQTGNYQIQRVINSKLNPGISINLSAVEAHRKKILNSGKKKRKLS